MTNRTIFFRVYVTGRVLREIIIVRPKKIYCRSPASFDKKGWKITCTGYITRCITTKNPATATSQDGFEYIFPRNVWPICSVFNENSLFFYIWYLHLVRAILSIICGKKCSINKVSRALLHHNMWPFSFPRIESIVLKKKKKKIITFIFELVSKNINVYFRRSVEQIRAYFPLYYFIYLPFFLYHKQ